MCIRDSLYFVRKYTGMKMDWLNTLGKPALATALMGLALGLAARWLPSGRIWTLMLVVIGVAAYAGFALLTGALTRDDLSPFLRRFQRRSAQKRED